MASNGMAPDCIMWHRMIVGMLSRMEVVEMADEVCLTHMIDMI